MWGGNKPCREKRSRSLSVKAVPLFQRGELIRSYPESETTCAFTVHSSVPARDANSRNAGFAGKHPPN